MDGVIDGGLKDGRMTPIFEDLFPRLCCGWSDIQCVGVVLYGSGGLWRAASCHGPTCGQTVRYFALCGWFVIRAR